MATFVAAAARLLPVRRGLSMSRHAGGAAAPAATVLRQLGAMLVQNQLLRGQLPAPLLWVLNPAGHLRREGAL